MSRPTQMIIDLNALRSNLTRVKQLAPHSAVIAMVKANGYGHGLVRVAQALHAAEALGVASLEEGVKLREAGITQPIVLMEGLFYPDELLDAAKYQFTLVVHHFPHVEILENAPKTIATPFSIWLKIDTGMHRLGIGPADVHLIHARLSQLPIVKQPIGLMTHFAEADVMSTRDQSATLRQLELFNTATHNLIGPRSLANSAAILAYPEAHADWVRPGLMLYGASPFKNNDGMQHELQPVMTLASRIIAIKIVKKGESVGYGGTWTARKDTLIGIVGVGYGDGYPQSAQNGTPVLVNDMVCSLAGRVSMDMLAVDLHAQPNAQIGDPVILWGSGLPVEQVAAHSHTSAYEVLTRMTPRPKIETIGD
jgi:alanine racemase